MSVWPVQIRQLLFSGVENTKPDKGKLELERTFKVPVTKHSHFTSQGVVAVSHPQVNTFVYIVVQWPV